MSTPFGAQQRCTWLFASGLGLLALSLGFLACGDSSEGSSGGATSAGTTAGTSTGDSATTGDSGGSGALWSEDCPLDVPEMRMIDVGELTLNVACQGSGPTLVLLHGFPEFWGGWSRLVPELASEYRLIMPDQRGYNLSDKPTEVSDFELDHLVADVVGLIDAVSSEPVTLVGHDWGGAVAWAVAASAPEKLKNLVILNAPHPDVLARELANNPAQREASSYVQLLITPGAETIIAQDNYALFASAVFDDTFTEDEKGPYYEAWGQEGAIKAMVSWYTANFTEGSIAATGNLVIDAVPTLVLWGLKDTALLPGNLDGLEDYVTDLQVQTFEEATHWIVHEEPAGVAEAIRAYLAGGNVSTSGGGTTQAATGEGTSGEGTTGGETGEPTTGGETGEGTTGGETGEGTTGGETGEGTGQAGPPTLPAGLNGSEAPEYAALPAMEGVTDEQGNAVGPADFEGHWTVLWFYPVANTFG